MSRHNRRRTRHKASLSPIFELPLLPPPTPPPPPATTAFASTPPRFHIYACANVDAANLWQYNETLAWGWQRQRPEADRMRIFGGSSGDEADEEGLCDKMMEFFGGLDFIHG